MARGNFWRRCVRRRQLTALPLVTECHFGRGRLGPAPLLWCHMHCIGSLVTHRLFDVVIVDLLDFSDAWHPQSELARPPHHKATTSDQQSSEVGGGDCHFHTLLATWPHRRSSSTPKLSSRMCGASCAGTPCSLCSLLGDRSLLPEACACPAFPMCRAPPSARQPPLLEAIHAQNGRPSFGGQPYHDSGKLVRRQTMKPCSLATSSHVLVDTSHISGGGNA